MFCILHKMCFCGSLSAETYMPAANKNSKTEYSRYEGPCRVSHNLCVRQYCLFKGEKVVHLFQKCRGTGNLDICDVVLDYSCPIDNSSLIHLKL